MSPREDKGAAAGIDDVPMLLAHAYAIEVEAEERYTQLADQMEVHNNPDVAALFRKLAAVERLHAEAIRSRAGATELPHIPPWEYRWPELDSPEAAEDGDAHYLMTPHHALKMALAAEQRALRFFQNLHRSSRKEDVRTLAGELAEEEREHVRLVRDLLARHPEPPEDWSEDLDPPTLQE